MIVHQASAGYTARTSVTRPANTTAYTAGDVVGAAAAAWTFTNVGPANDRQTSIDGANILITSAFLRINVTSVPAGMTSFRLHLYTSSPTSAYADNAAWTLHADDLTAYAGYIDLGSPALPAAASGAIYVQADQLNKQIKLAAGSSTLYGYLVTNAGYTPTSAAVKAIELHTVAI